MLLPVRKAQSQNPVHHSTPWCEESLRRGQGSTDIVLGPIEAPAGHGSAAWIPNTTKLHSLFLCRHIQSTQNFRFDSHNKIVVITFQYYLIYDPTG